MKTGIKKMIITALAAVLMSSCLFSGMACYADFSKTEATELYKKLGIDDLSSTGIASADAVSGELIMERDGYVHVNVGNMVKLMTLLICFERIDSGKLSLDTEFSVTKHAQEVSVGRIRVYLDSGKAEKIKVTQAIEAICINGAQDAACALAEFIGGNEEAFVLQMNARAKELGLNNTLFTDSTGIGTEQYSCAADMAVIMAELVGRHQSALDYLNLTYGMFSHDSTGQGTTEMVSSNPLNRKKFYTESDGSMTGYSKEYGYSLACTAAKDEKRVVAVVAGAETENQRAAEVRRLAEYSLSNFEYAQLSLKGTFVKKVEIKDGKAKKIKTETAEDYYALLNVKDVGRIKTAIEIDTELVAPVEEGTVCGHVIYLLDEEEIGRVELVTSESVARANWFTRLIRRILAFFGL